MPRRITVKLSISVVLNGRNPVNSETAPFVALQADSSSVIVKLATPAGNLAFKGKVQADGSLTTLLRLPAALEDMTLTLEAEGFEGRSVVIRGMSMLAEVNRTMGMLARGPAAKNASLPSDDRDGDGVSDQYDAFPDDPRSAFAEKVPADGAMTIAFEDLFLRTQAGDAGYNDFLVRYQPTVITDGLNRVVRVEGDSTAVVKLAGYTHRFGFFVHPFAGKAALEVEDFSKTGQLVATRKQAVNGQADIILFNNTATAVGKRATFSLEFEEPQAASQIDQPPCNPYLFVYNTG
jgi:hypothetical protein